MDAHPNEIKNNKLGVYVLFLEGDNYYVGFSSNVYERIGYHFLGQGTAWTKLHHPLKVLEFIPNGDTVFEENKTLEMMCKYGYEHVRGGPWCEVDLKDPPLKQIYHRMNVCFECHQNGHMVSECPQRKQDTVQNSNESAPIPKEINTPITNPILSFFQDTLIGPFFQNLENSNTPNLVQQPTPISKRVCTRCGRNSHTVENCYAKTNIRRQIIH